MASKVAAVDVVTDIIVNVNGVSRVENGDSDFCDGNVFCGACGRGFWLGVKLGCKCIGINVQVSVWRMGGIRAGGWSLGGF